MRRVLLLLLLAGCAAEAKPASVPPPLLRVRLASVAARDEVRIEIAGAYRVLNGADGAALEEGKDLSRAVPVRGASLASPLRIEPVGGLFSVEDRTYRGALIIRPGEAGGS